MAWVWRRVWKYVVSSEMVVEVVGLEMEERMGGNVCGEKRKGGI